MLKPLPRTCLIKVPRQRRSVEMVHAILDAGIIVLQRDGMAAFNTNHVARVAGVSVGSLYQYFANRDMIVAGIVERGVADAEALIRSAVARSHAAPIGDVVRGLLHGLLLSLEPYSDLLYEVLSATPVLSQTGVSAVLETRLNDALTDFLTLNPGVEIAGGRAGRYLLVNAAIYVTLKWLGERPAAVSREQLVEVFSAQFTGALIRPGA